MDKWDEAAHMVESTPSVTGSCICPQDGIFIAPQILGMSLYTVNESSTHVRFYSPCYWVCTFNRSNTQ